MLEQIIFLLVSFSLFVLIFSKIIRRNDSNYFLLLILQAFGIAICFFEIKLKVSANILLKIIRYIFAGIMPILILILEAKGIFFSEFITKFVAKLYISVNNTKKAKDILVKFVSKYPENYYGHKLLAEVYEIEGGMRKAIDEYVMVLDIKGDDHNSYYRIAYLLNELGKKDESIEMLQNLLKSKPEYYDGTKLLGDILCEQERFKEAANVYQDALKYHSADFDLYYDLGMVFTRLNDFSQAKEMYEKAAELNHRLYNAYYNLGQICFIEKDLEAAEKYFEKSIYGEDVEAMSYYQLAKIYAIKDQKDKAITFVNKAIELDQSLLKKAEKDTAFSEIKQYITVSVKMDNEIEEKNTQKEFEELKKSDEVVAQKHLEETTELVQKIKENTVSEKVSSIIKNEKLKKFLEKAQEDDERLENELDSKEIEKDNNT